MEIQTKNPFDSLLDAFRQIVREEINNSLKTTLGGSGSQPRMDWLRSDELASIYNLPKTWFEDRGRDGAIKRTKPGKHMLFYRPDVDKYLVVHAEGGDKKTN